MIPANARVVESAIPAAEGKVSFTNGATLKQRRELDDITAWLEEQEEAELEFLVEELAGKQHRAMRRSLHA